MQGPYNILITFTIPFPTFQALLSCIYNLYISLNKTFLLYYSQYSFTFIYSLHCSLFSPQILFPYEIIFFLLEELPLIFLTQ